MNQAARNRIRFLAGSGFSFDFDADPVATAANAVRRDNEG
jgi:hypothetical protein